MCHSSHSESNRIQLIRPQSCPSRLRHAAAVVDKCHHRSHAQSTKTMHGDAGPATLALERCKKRRRVEEKSSDVFDPFSFDDVFNDINETQNQESFPVIAWNSDDDGDDSAAETLPSLQLAAEVAAAAPCIPGMKRQRSSQRCLQRSTAFTKDLAQLEIEASTNHLSSLLSSSERTPPNGAHTGSVVGASATEPELTARDAIPLHIDEP
jgi:hypothetical protein